MKRVLDFFKRKNLVTVVPPLVGLIVAVANIYDIQIDEATLTNQILVIGGLVGAAIGIFTNPDKLDGGLDEKE